MSIKYTLECSSELQQAYDFFNQELFDGELPECIIVLCNTNKRMLGYYHQSQYVNKKTAKVIDKIALNPQYFASEGLMDVLSTLVHEMCHLWRWRLCGKPPRSGYHDKKWGQKMKEVGLHPSDTGEPGGKETGQSVSDYIVDGGKFSSAAKTFIENGFELTYMHRIQLGHSNEELKDSIEKLESEGANGLREAISTVNLNDERPKKNKSNRVKYICGSCKMQVWGKPNLAILCGTCKQELCPEGEKEVLHG